MKLITGGTGLLGSEILKLEQNSVGISSKECNLINDKEKFIQIAKSNKVTSVIHCAARVGGVKANTDFVGDFFNENIKMNCNVLDACKELDLKLTSILSTCIYPDATYVQYPLTEDQLHLGPPHASNFGYAYAKRMLDVSSRAYRQQWNCNFITVIPNNLYGPQDNYDTNSGHVIPSLIKKFFIAKQQKTDVTIWGSGRPMREFTFSRDAAKIILWCSENYSSAEPINIGNSEQISIGDLAALISKIIGFKGNLKFDSSKPDGQFKKPSNNLKLRSLGYDPAYTSLEIGLEETIEYFVKTYPNLRGCKNK